MKRYFELFAIVAIMTLITMGIQVGLSHLVPITGFWWTYFSFVIIFFALLATILHFPVCKIKLEKQKSHL